MQELSSKLYANVLKPKPKNKTPTRKTPKVRGYIDNVHDLCLHNAGDILDSFKKPRASLEGANRRNVPRDKSRNATAKNVMKSPLKKKFEKMLYAVSQSNQQTANNSLLQHANTMPNHVRTLHSV